MNFWYCTGITALLVTTCLFSGCCSEDSYPSAAPVAAAGRSAKCEHCEKEIANVDQDNLFDFQGVQYTVCSSECSEKLKVEIVYGGGDEH